MSEELCECRMCVKKREENRLAAAAIEVAVLTVYDDPEEGESSSADVRLNPPAPPPRVDESFEEDSLPASEINRLPLMNANPTPAAGDFRDHVIAITDRLREVLLRQGDQVITKSSPVRIFSKVDPVEKLNMRIDESLSRLMQGDDSTEDPEWNLITDLALKRVVLEMAARHGARE